MKKVIFSIAAAILIFFIYKGFNKMHYAKLGVSHQEFERQLYDEWYSINNPTRSKNLPHPNRYDSNEITKLAIIKTKEKHQIK